MNQISLRIRAVFSDLSLLCLAHMSEGTFSHASAHKVNVYTSFKDNTLFYKALRQSLPTVSKFVTFIADINLLQATLKSHNCSSKRPNFSCQNLH